MPKKSPRLRFQAPSGPVTTRRATREELGMGEAPDTKRYADAVLRWQILDRDRFRCRYCGAKVTFDNANIDHVYPWKRGGLTANVNLVACCQPCNKAKGNRWWTPKPLKPAFGHRKPNGLEKAQKALARVR